MLGCQVSPAADQTPMGGPRVIRGCSRRSLVTQAWRGEGALSTCPVPRILILTVGSRPPRAGEGRPGEACGGPGELEGCWAVRSCGWAAGLGPLSSHLPGETHGFGATQAVGQVHFPEPPFTSEKREIASPRTGLLGDGECPATVDVLRPATRPGQGPRFSSVGHRTSSEIRQLAGSGEHCGGGGGAYREPGFGGGTEGSHPAFVGLADLLRN